MSRLRIVHRTGFSYSRAATASYNEARMLPWHGSGQFVLSSELHIDPVAHQHSYIDYWGTRVSTFDVLTPHTELSVTATSLVDVAPVALTGTRLGWEELAGLRETASVYVEQLRQTEATQPPEDVAALAAEIVSRGLDPHDAALEICRAIGDGIQYVPGSTRVSSTARESWDQGKGVCQDIAHIALGALRSVGIPARYVSGYLHPKREAAIGETVIGESHAWVEWFSGDWVGYDPTNQLEIGDRHVLVGRGRSYSDVSPLRGVYAGPSASKLFVRVEITREA
ncbi:transglutaminase [Leifsonia sp. Leaf325]|nr:transglutaminase family protein [Leifsonia sp. Leaf325]KQQ93047.1 transglutaminase [Leifsonia sp. Leaf325]